MLAELNSTGVVWAGIVSLLVAAAALGAERDWGDPAKMDRAAIIERTMTPYEGESVRGVDTSTMTGKVLCGYQGWHAAQGDGAGRGWYHWQGHQGFKPGSCNIDLWPDVSELGADERYATEFRLADGRAAEVYSAFPLDQFADPRHCCLVEIRSGPAREPPRAHAGTDRR